MSRVMELDEQIRKLQEEKDRIYAEERKTALADIPGWYPAGSALHGVGVPECIADGRKVARGAVAGIGSATASR